MEVQHPLGVCRVENMASRCGASQTLPRTRRLTRAQGVCFDLSPHECGPHRQAPSRGFHTGPAGRVWDSGSHGLLGDGRWFLPSRLGSAAQRSVHIRWEKEGCLGWRLRSSPGLEQVPEAAAVLWRGRGIEGWMGRSEPATCFWPRSQPDWQAGPPVT